MSYYQKYRPEKVGDLDLNGVRETLTVMMAAGKLSHAYLLVGPRGSGKTSAARILARLINCSENYTKDKLNKVLVEPCGKCPACLSIKSGSAVDVMEIDAASHGGVEDIRDLRDKINLAPAALACKVYIIDEVHMLSTGAFNALLKTLEEPPKNVVFILCTTEAHKVPETIASRCVKLKFSKGSPAEVENSLARAIKGEKIEIDKKALALLAERVDGSFREGHKLLEQLAQKGEKIDEAAVREALKIIGDDQLGGLLSAVGAGEAGAVVEMIKKLESEGVDAVNLVTRLLMRLKESLRAAAEGGQALSGKELTLMKRLIAAAGKIKISPLPLLPVEMALVKQALKNGGGGGRANRPEEKMTIKEKVVREVKQTKEVEKSMGVSVDFEKIVSGWQDLLTRLAPRNHSVAGLLRSAKPKELDDKFLTIEVFYKFHKEQLEQEGRRRIIEEEIEKLWGPMSVKCVLGNRVVRAGVALPTATVQRVVNDSEAVKEAEEVFGV